MTNRKGFLLVGVMIIFLLLLLIVPVMVKFVQYDTKISVKDQKSTIAFSLAEAAVDRGYWKVKNSTTTFAQVMTGGTLPGYHFDTAYTEISGGSYRINITSGPLADQITVYGEGRDSFKKEFRAIKAVYNNSSVPGAILSGGKLTADAGSTVHWGPIMAKGDITVSTGTDHSGNNLRTYYPRKLSQGTVRPLDPTGDTNPPNTDNLEWWSNYNVPELPVFDLTAMRSSAAATGTLDCRDVYHVTYTTTTTIIGYTVSPTTCDGVASQTCSCDGSGHFGCNSRCSGSCSSSVASYSPSPATCGTVSCSCSGSTFKCTGATTSCKNSGSCSHGNPSPTTCAASSPSNCSCNSSGVFSCSGACAPGTCNPSSYNYTPVPTSCNYTIPGSETCSCNGSGTFNCGSATCTGSCTEIDNYAVNGTTNSISIGCCSVSGGVESCAYENPTPNHCTNCVVTDLYDSAYRDKDYTWYWDKNVTWQGYTGTRGTIVAVADMMISSYPAATADDRYCRGGTGAHPGSTKCTVAVPKDAWKEYQEFDTTKTDEYPGDLGKSSSTLTYAIGTSDTESGGSGGDLGIYGFLYVGGNLARYGASDIYGAVWVKGDVSGTGNTMVFYNAKLKVPTLNVVLMLDSWKETPPSAAAWP